MEMDEISQEEVVDSEAVESKLHEDAREGMRVCFHFHGDRAALVVASLERRVARLLPRLCASDRVVVRSSRGHPLWR